MSKNNKNVEFSHLYIIFWTVNVGGCLPILLTSSELLYPNANLTAVLVVVHFPSVDIGFFFLLLLCSNFLDQLSLFGLGHCYRNSLDKLLCAEYNELVEVPVTNPENTLNSAVLSIFHAVLIYLPTGLLLWHYLLFSVLNKLRSLGFLRIAVSI